MRLLTAMLLIAAGLTTAAQERTITYHYDRSYDFYDVEIEVNHMNANLTIKPYDTLVIGEAEFTFKTLRGQIDSLVLMSGIWISNGSKLTVLKPVFQQKATTHSFALL